MKFLDIETLRDRVNEDLKFNEFSLIEENQKNVSKHHYYLTLLYEEEEKLEKLKQTKDVLYKELYQFYKWGKSKIYPSKTFDRMVKSEDIKVLIDGDEKWQKFMKLYRKQEAIVKYLTHVEKLFSNRYYSLTNAVKLWNKEQQ